MSQIVPQALAGQQLLEFYEGLYTHIIQGPNPESPHRYLVEMTLADLRARAAREKELLSTLMQGVPGLTVDEINAIVTPDTGWEVSLATSPHDQSEFLHLWRRDAAGARVLLTSLPREAGPGVLCAFGSVARHYKELGARESGDAGAGGSLPAYSSENPAPCPFCGRKPDMDGDDTLYPTGRWREDDGLRHYLMIDDERESHGTVYTMHCPETYGGCGAQVAGDSKDDVMAKWNRRSQK